MDIIVESLRCKTFRALYWSFMESVALRGVQFIIVIFLALLLLPEQFGLIEMLTILMIIGAGIPRQWVGSRLDSETRGHANRYLVNILLKHHRRTGGDGLVMAGRSLDCRVL